jgi:hypothetical protein
MRSQRRLAMLAMLACFAIGTGGVLAGPACLADITRFCADTPAGGGEIQACLKSHEKELSPDCVNVLTEFKRRSGALAATCRWDIARLCSDVSPGGGRIASCLQAKRDDLSPECKDRFKPAH